MKTRGLDLRGLLATTALVTGLAAAAPAFAQTAETSAPDETGNGLLGEVVVTATRQADTVNRVPLSISAVSQRSLDQQGVRDVGDLQRTVPALTVSGTTGGIQNFAIRGVQSTAGAATTGIYLDDTSLTKRSAVAIAQYNGSPAPPLFDLERVEVLRGPQGTLYGGSSEGGTIRFITPQPSLTRYSAYARTELSSTKGGAMSYEGGVAVGGPIVRDKLGFRISGFGRHTGGFIDMVDPYNQGALVIENENERDLTAFRGALTFAPAERLRGTLSYYYSNVAAADTGDAYTRMIVPGTITSARQCFDTSRNFATGAARAVACPTGAVPSNIFVRPAQTYGPFDWLDGHENLQRSQNPTATRLQVASLTVDWDVGKVNAKAISSYIQDHTTGYEYSSHIDGFNVWVPPGYSTAITRAGLTNPDPRYYNQYAKDNARYGVSQEFRLSSAADARPLSWVAGVYYSNVRTRSSYNQLEDLTFISRTMFGLSVVQQYGVDILPGNVGSARTQHLIDNELAAFGEANYWLTDRIKLTAGLRYSRVRFTYDQISYGPAVGTNTPTTANLGISEGEVIEKPLTPKFGAQYQIDEDDMVYVSAAKGYRAGGVNAPLPAACVNIVGVFGLGIRDIPESYGSDSVWSYEAGGKFRIGRNLQVNSSIYQIDWSGVQLNTAICAGWTLNAGKARSRGFDLQAQARLFNGLTADLAVGYNKAEYVETALGPQPLSGAPRTPFVQAGDAFAIPPWTVTLGLRYDFQVANRNGYVRGDYTYASSYPRTPGPGSGGFQPDVFMSETSNQVNVRAGVVFGGFDLNVFARNLLDSKDIVGGTGGRSGCPVASGAACTPAGNFQPYVFLTPLRPREIGIQLAYRY